MAQDTVDAAIKCKSVDKVAAIEALNSELGNCAYTKITGRKVLKTLLNRLRLKRCASVEISRPDPTFKVAYLGNVVTGWAKGKLYYYILYSKNSDLPGYSYNRYY